MSFRIPRKEPPKQSSSRERCSLSGTLQLSEKIPSQRTPQVSQRAPKERAPVSRAFFYTFLSKFQVNEPPTMFSNRAPMEREVTSPETMLYSLIYICQSPPIRSPSTKNEEYIWSSSTEPHVDGRPTYNGVRPGSPRGSFTTLQSLPQCHAAVSTIPSTLAWVDQSPVSQYVS